MSEDADDSDSDDEEPPRLPDGSDSDSDSDEDPEGDKASNSTKEEVIVEDVDDDDDDDDDLPENQASDIPRPPEILGRGMRIRKQPQNCVPSMAGKKYEWGGLNLCYRGN